MIIETMEIKIVVVKPLNKNFKLVNPSILLGDKISQWHITNGTVDEINRSEASYLFEKSFETNPIPQCVKICGKKIEDSVGEDGNIQRLDVRLK